MPGASTTRLRTGRSSTTPSATYVTARLALHDARSNARAGAAARLSGLGAGGVRRGLPLRRRATRARGRRHRLDRKRVRCYRLDLAAEREPLAVIVAFDVDDHDLAGRQ